MKDLGAQFIVPFGFNVFVQKFRKGLPERGLNGERPLVILSEAKNDTGWPIRLPLPDALMVQ